VQENHRRDTIISHLSSVQSLALAEASRASCLKEALDAEAIKVASLQAQLTVYHEGAGLCLSLLGPEELVGTVADIVGGDDLRWIGVSMRQRVGFAVLAALLSTWRRALCSRVVRCWQSTMGVGTATAAHERILLRESSIDTKLANAAQHHESILVQQGALVRGLQDENATLKEEIKIKMVEVGVLQEQFTGMATRQLDQTRLMENDAIQAVIKIAEANLHRAHASVLFTVLAR
jgi:hypothetical protein